MTTISWSSFVLVALVWVLVISKVREKYPCRTTDAVVLPSDKDGEVLLTLYRLLHCLWLQLGRINAAGRIHRESVASHTVARMGIDIEAEVA